MFKIVAPKLLKNFNGMSIFVFIFLKDKSKLNDHVLINHELVHFHQQVELGFVIHWILYGIFYLIKRIKTKDHYTAYRQNPFEHEAYDNEENLKYLFERKPYAWKKYIIPFFKNL